ncbi:MAG: bifunctional UDP-N-acetylmuramoyl-L-alanyl-D-glutamate--2,6-diaminopimelate ligase MurE/UDP-N-acetylmuramoyl-tripeptide--D-alanyl-D-alanine ligase MurF [Betaproteobacteria bacterium]|nr:bifunctional UDP-N-acetylmuramoyl-L-alanyl-D-glutamate--2,6-diaminopimelate ligase MurE/UDP-N-acetylmuramoyl-tripeptide--D-alanyl-D-alanine ligase MurF [Betaproteobacteria bacterium]
MVASGLLHLNSVEQALDWLRAAGARRLVVDSRAVTAGDAFLAWPGAAHDARRFVPQALAAGACACLVAQEGVEAFGFDDERVAALPQLKQRLGTLCSAFWEDPSASMEVLAVTGTNGKTSTAWWWAQASAALGRRSAVVGTLGMGEPPAATRAGRWTTTGLTTPDPATLHGGLAAFGREGVKRCAIEASSIGIAEDRLQALSITVALFTNFTQDHLDYHHTLDRYWAAKRQLFDWPTLSAAVINVDDPRGAQLLAQLRSQRPALDLWSVGLSGAVRLGARAIQPTATGMRFELVEAGSSTLPIDVPFLGHHNLYNLLGVVAALRALGHGLQEIAAVLPRLSPVPGRLQALGGAGEPLAVVDYAHTPDALDKALQALRPVAQARGGRLWCVFGCGGDRDRSKRPLMGAVAQRLADAVVLTSDNPRSEDPHAILADIRAGLAPNPALNSEPDRRQAIWGALNQACTRDVVLVAGKGHEGEQEIQGVRHPFSDVEVVDAGLRARAARGFMTLGDAAGCIGAGVVLHGDPQTVISRVHTDTRTLQAGDLYVALRGERFDGHAFLDQAHRSGAVAMLAQQGLASNGLSGLEVADSLKGLQSLARGWRSQLDLPVIAVTGSNGKTTVTQMTASILRAWRGERAAYTRGNLNNHIGVPLSVLSLRAGAEQGHQVAVLELGMNHPGEVELLAGMAQPTVAVVNNAQREHQEFMHTVEAVARENGAVLQALPVGGTAVFPADDRYATVWAQMAAHARRWRFSFEVMTGTTGTPGVQATAAADAGRDSTPAEVRGQATWEEDHWSLQIQSPVGAVKTTVHLPGRHNLHNAMAAASAALAAGAPLQAVAAGLSAFQAVSGRSQLSTLVRHGRRVTLIDDTYNANPDSVRAAIDVLAELPGPHALILGDMGEVGEQGPAFHAEVGGYAHQRGVEQLWTLGDLCLHSAAAYGTGARHFDSLEQLTAALDDLASAQSVLVKGSRFMRMERVVAALHALTAEAG